MTFGIFCNQQRARSDVATSWSEDIEEIIAGDRLGLAEAWISEHTGSPWLPDALPSPDHMICALSRVTSQIRLGSAIRRLALYHPLQVATEIAVCDQLTGGRYMFGFGRGGPVTGWGQRGIEWDDTHEMMVESVGLIMRAFEASEPFDHQGRFYEGKDIAVYPRLLQQPRPPVAVATGNPRLLRMAAEQGFRLLTSQVGAPEDILRLTNEVAKYMDGPDAASRAKRSATAVRGVYVGESDAAAVRDVRAGWEANLDFNKQHFPGNFNKWLRPGETLDDLSFDRLRERGLMWVGSPDTVAAGLRRFYEKSGGFGTFLLITGRDWGTLPQRLRSLELFAEEVIPRVSDLELLGDSPGFEPAFARA